MGQASRRHDDRLGHPGPAVHHGARATGSARDGTPGSSARITCWAQHRRSATTTDGIAGQLATDRIADHQPGWVNFTSAIPKTSRRWVNSKSATRRTSTWWVRSPSAIPGHFSVRVGRSDPPSSGLCAHVWLFSPPPSGGGAVSRSVARCSPAAVITFAGLTSPIDLWLSITI